MAEAIETLRQWVAESNNIVFFGGAGVSTESGIPDFRSVDGLYNQKWAYPPETILSHSFFERDPAEFYRFYREKLVVHGAKPNAAHLKLAQWEKEGRLRAVRRQQKRAGAARLHPALLLRPVPEALPGQLHQRRRGRAPL